MLKNIFELKYELTNNNTKKTKTIITNMYKNSNPDFSSISFKNIDDNNKLSLIEISYLIDYLLFTDHLLDRLVKQHNLTYKISKPFVYKTLWRYKERDDAEISITAESFFNNEHPLLLRNVIIPAEISRLKYDAVENINIKHMDLNKDKYHYDNINFESLINELNSSNGRKL